MLLSRILFTVSLLIFIQDAIGVEESSGNKDYTDESGSGQNTLNNASTNDVNSDSSCGLYTRYSDCSFHHELVNLRSNHIINITTDVMLLSTILLVGLENISIIGYDNPAVNCNNVGGIRLDSCHNCAILGIIWEKCGTKNDSIPAIEIYNSSNIVIQNCSFQHSVTQVIALSEMLGNVIINGCTFAFNNYLEGHGTAIHYLPKFKHQSRVQFTIMQL